MRERKGRSFTPEFKRETVRRCEVGDRSIAQVAKDLDVTDMALRDWVKRAEVDAGKGPVGALTTAEREERAPPYN
jgi:transposase-like protein